MTLSRKETLDIIGSTEEEEQERTRLAQAEEPSWLHSKNVDDARNTNTNELPSVDVLKTSEERKFICDVCGKEVSTSLALSGHKRTHAPKGTLSRTAEKSEPTAKEISGLLPENLKYLESVLKGFSAKSVPNIISGMQDNPSDLNELRDLLVASGTDQKSHTFILRRYGNYTGQPLPSEGNVVVEKASPVKAMYEKMRNDRMEEAYIKMMEAQAGGANRNPETESLKLQLAEMGKRIEERDRKIEEIFTKREQEEKLKSLEGGIGQIGSVLKDFMIDQDKKFTDFLHRQELEKKDKEIQQISNNSAAPLAEKMLNKVDNLISNAGDGFMNVNKRVMEYNQSEMKGQQALTMRNAGFAPDQITAILANQPQKPKIDLQAEYQNLQRVTGTEAQPKPKTMEETTAEHFKAMPPLKMNVEA